MISIKIQQKQKQKSINNKRPANSPFIRKGSMKSRQWRSQGASVGVLRATKCDKIRYFSHKKSLH
jgi:hypothetical protein